MGQTSSQTGASGMAVRLADEADLPDVLALYAESGPADEGGLGLQRARDVFARFSLYPSYRLFVVHDELRRVVGTYALLIMDNLSHHGRPSAIVEAVIVAPTFRRQGIGRLMMMHALSLAREAGCYKLALSSNLQRIQAHAFYASLGFVQHGWSFVADL